MGARGIILAYKAYKAVPLLFPQALRGEYNALYDSPVYRVGNRL